MMEAAPEVEEPFTPQSLASGELDSQDILLDAVAEEEPRPLLSRNGARSELVTPIMEVPTGPLLADDASKTLPGVPLGGAGHASMEEVWNSLPTDERLQPSYSRTQLMMIDTAIAGAFPEPEREREQGIAATDDWGELIGHPEVQAPPALAAIGGGSSRADFDHFVRRLGQGVRLMHTPKFNLHLPTDPTEVMLMGWLESTDTLDGLRRMAGGRIPEEKLTRLVYGLYDRALLELGPP